MKTFEDIYKDRPDKAEVGSSGYSNMKNLYEICHRLRPDFVFESGTWKGNSSWLFSHFVGLTCFDIDFSNLMWIDETITYINDDIEKQDWTSNDWGVFIDDATTTLFFFDDHISQLKRLQFLIKVNAKYAVFDDNQPSTIAKTLKNPPSPTLEELRDQNHPIMKQVKHYEVMPFHGDRRNFDTRLTYIEL